MPRFHHVTCFFCNLAFNSKELHTAHMKASHFQCVKCDFWLEKEIHQYDHTCIPKKPQEPVCSVVVEPHEIEHEEEKENYSDSLEFRWRKCANHAATHCAINELRNCEDCRLMRFSATSASAKRKSFKQKK
jgi:hypothetical protein